MEKTIALGAEAVLIKQDGKLTKKRIEKKYRYKELDKKLRKLRTRKEAKLLEKASSLINVPRVIKVDDKTKKIIMEFIEGKKLSDCLDLLESKKAIEICKTVGSSIAKLHDANIIHGDLTTSNMILKESKGKFDKEKHGFSLFFIDFGLGFESSRTEDKAVDLHLLRQAFESKHFSRWQGYFDAALEGYKESRNAASVLRQFEKVEARGRYKGKLGRIDGREPMIA